MSPGPDPQRHATVATALMTYVLESGLDMALIDRGGRILEISRVSSALSGVPRDLVVGRLIQETYPDAMDVVELMATDAIAEPHTVPPRAIRHPDGTVTWYRTDISPWRDETGEIGGVICVSQNITAEQRALDELSRAQTLLDAVFESIPLLVSVQDRDTGAYVRVNRAVEECIGKPRDEVVGRGPEANIDADAIQRRLAHVDQVEATGATLSSEEEISDRHGQTRTLFVRRQLISDQSGRRHILSVGEDITERKRADAALKAAVAEAEAGNKAKSVFLATMSHEIRTPLNGVLGMAQAMARDDLSSVQRERLEVVRRSGEALLAILGDVLDLSKIEAGKLELEEIEFDLAEMAEGAAGAFSGLAAAKGLEFKTDVSLAAGTYRGDPGRLRQILSNLLANAVKFTEKGWVGLTAAPAGEGTVEFTVFDTGPGIPPEALGRLFQKFVQVDSSTTRRFGGTGLGLAICRELAELMGGSIRAESDYGLGARFVLTLPLKSVGENRLKARAELIPIEARPGLRILAAEDNHVNQIVLKTILEQAGLDVTLVSDGAQAAKAFAEGAWDLVLMDVQMPVMDGPAATRAIRDLERRTARPRTPIIALTANAMEHQRADYLASGMDDVVVKPIQIVDLFAAIENLVGKPESLPGAPSQVKAR